MANHSSILAWRTPWTEEPGSLQSIDSQSWTLLNGVPIKFYLWTLKHEFHIIFMCHRILPFLFVKNHLKYKNPT